MVDTVLRVLHWAAAARLASWLVVAGVYDGSDSRCEEVVRPAGDLQRYFVAAGILAQADGEFLPSDDRIAEGVRLGRECFYACLDSLPVQVVEVVVTERLANSRNLRRLASQIHRAPARDRLAWAGRQSAFHPRVDQRGWAAVSAALFVGVGGIVLKRWALNSFVSLTAEAHGC
jgi:hypothetical protein